MPPLGLTLPLPAPAYWGSLFRVNAHIEGGHRAFFLGEIGSEGWWSYFLVAFLVKTPLATLLLLLAAAGLTARRRRWLADLPFWLPAGLLLAFASYSRLNIGYRHILPALPLLIGWIGVTAGRLDPAGIWRRRRRTARPLLTLFLVAVIAPTLAVRPSYLAFFNRAVGGPAGGFRLLGDSNLDWGQDWKGAAAYARGQELTATYMLPFGFVDPAYYGLAAESLITADGWAIPSFAPANPAAGTYLLSVNALQGMLADPDLLDWFRRRTPSEMRATGYSIYVYEVESPAAGSWVAHCVDPGPRLTPDEAEQLLGIGEVRHVFFDCRSGWVFPQNGAPGWYILPPKDSAWWLQGELGTSLAEIYAHRATFDLPEFEVVYWDGRRDPADATAIPAPPVPEEGPAVLVGGWAGDTAWRTVWRVRRPTDRPLSVLGHRFDRSGQPAGVADGLVYATSHWEAGDLFVQVHEFDDPAPPFELETGLYDYVTEEREGPTSRLRAGGQ